jgi:tRNA(Ile)-lysidine synthase
LLEDLPAETVITVGFSGGRDSVVLLDALSRLLPNDGSRLKALHVHHGLSKYADEWADFCTQFAAERGVHCAIHHASIKSDGAGLEAAARLARFSAFAEAGASVVALAHHLDDQAETVLLRLFRGSGVHGLAAMPRLRQQANQQILWRPFLDQARAELENYAARHALQWVEDDSNAYQYFTRNYLRHTVLPELASRFPAVKLILGRTAQLADEASVLLDERAEEDLAACQSAQDSSALGLVQLQQLAPARLRNLLRYWLKLQGWPAPEMHTLLEWQKQLECADAGSMAVLSYSAGECRLWQGNAYCVSRTQNLLKPVELTELPSLQNSSLAFGDGVINCCDKMSITGGEHDVNSYILRLDKAAVENAFQQDNTLRFASRSGGEKLQLAANRPNRPLKKHLQDSGFPPWVKASFPLMFIGETLVGCFGIGVKFDWLPKPNSDCFIFVWYPRIPK